MLISTAVGRILHFSRRFDEAIEQCRRTIEMNPRFPLAHFDVAIAYGNVGRYTEAIEAFKKWAELLGDKRLGRKEAWRLSTPRWASVRKPSNWL